MGATAGAASDSHTLQVTPAPAEMSPARPPAPAALPAPLPVERLRWRCDPANLGFTSLAEVPPLDGMIGQERAVDAIELGLDLAAPGYNVFVSGPAGTGRTSTARHHVTRAAAVLPAAQDVCYVHNFESPPQPIALLLPPGQGPELAADLDQLIAGCRRDIPRNFESEEYEQKRNAAMQRSQGQREAVFEALRTRAAQLGFTVRFTPTGVITVPFHIPGHPLTSEEFDLLTPQEKAEIKNKGQVLEGEVDEALHLLRRIERETAEQLQAHDREAVLFSVGHALNALRTKYAALPRVLAQLEAIQSDLVAHLDEFRERGSGSQVQVDGDGSPLLERTPAYERYRANVLVTHSPKGGAPVVVETNPTYYNLLGRVDYRATIGAMFTDFTLIRAGALHRANGGYLVLNARDVLLNPFAWDALKRALRNGEVRMENLGEQYSAFPSAVLKPEPTPLRVKVVLIGDAYTYLLLYHLDEDFRKLFKVKAQFGPDMDRTPEAIGAFAAFVRRQVEEHALPAFDPGAVARVVEHAARLAEHQQRLATRFNVIVDLLLEAAHGARREGAALVSAAHVDRALAAQERRANLVEEDIQRLIGEGTLNIQTEGRVVGQVNGLSVIDLGDYAFAHPTRITARTGMGADGVVNVEREARLSGKIHSKGVEVLSGYLLGAYAQDRPLALAAHLAFEQVYGEVDGDSASSTELYALLSSLADAPIDQGIAVTGSVNQRGEVQAVGGVTLKIEGYFQVCAARGLTGAQGVIIPEANVRHLMLRQEVLDAVAAGQFHVWAVRHVDEGLALLTGMPAGERRPDGSYPPGSLHARVQERLATYARRLAELSAHRPTRRLAAASNGAAPGISPN